MKESKVLVVYFSRSGATRKVAEVLHERLGGEMVEIHTRQYPKGIRGYLRAGLDSVIGRSIPIRFNPLNDSSYDLVVIGTPVWNASVSAPIRNFITHALPETQRVAFFLTQGGSGDKRVFSQMEDLAGKHPLATLAIAESEVRRRKFNAKLDEFLNSLRSSSERQKHVHERRGRKAA